MPETDLTDEWKSWMRMQSTRDIEKKNCHTFSVKLHLSEQWMVWHPWSDVYMLVPQEEYEAEYLRYRRGPK